MQKHFIIQFLLIKQILLTFNLYHSIVMYKKIIIIIFFKNWIDIKTIYLSKLIFYLKP